MSGVHPPANERPRWELRDGVNIYEPRGDCIKFADARTEHHSPEESTHLLRAELDACKAEIERLRGELDAARVEIRRLTTHGDWLKKGWRS